MSGAISVNHGPFGRAAIYELNRPIITHGHREGHLVFHLDGSEACVTVHDTSYALSREKAVAISPWEPHSFEPKGDITNPTLCLVLYIKPIWFLETSQSAQFALQFGRSTITMDEAVKQWVHRLSAVLLGDEKSDHFDDYLFETAAQCFRQSWQNREDDSPLQVASRRFSDFRVRRALQIMQENYTETFDMESLARNVGLSRPHFFKLFKKQMGVTPNLYLNTLRSERAIEQLTTTDKTVSDIGFDLGFSSQASFTRFFVSNVGIPPSDYRRVSNLA